jgi:RNA polymerase sigma-70 factor (sigma-E family)
MASKYSKLDDNAGDHLLRLGAAAASGPDDRRESRLPVSAGSATSGTTARDSGRPAEAEHHDAGSEHATNPDTADGLVDGLFKTHAIALIRLALLLVGDRASAEDVVQDAFLGLHRSLPKLRDHSKALAYLRTSVVNGCRSVQRSRRRAWLRRADHDPPAWSAESAAIASEERRAVLAAVAGLPTRAREVLALRYYLDLPDNEIAAALGISRGTVSSTASRALAALARELKEQQ